MFSNFFSTITIKSRDLRSRQLRLEATGGRVGGLVSLPGANGIRKIDVDQVDTGQLAQNSPATGVRGFINKIINPIKKFIGFAWPLISRILPRSWSELWSTIVQVGFAVWTFDWNQTDGAIENQIKANNLQILNAAAAAAGTALGWGAVRVVNMAAGKLFKSPAGQQNQGRDRSLDIKMPIITGRAAAALAEEGNEEVRGAMQALLGQIKAAQTRNAFLSFMLHSRSEGWFGMKSISQPGANDSFAKRWEDKVESLPQWLQAPVENFAENFVEAVLEAGFIWANEADSAYAMARAAMKDARGQERTIVYQPDNRLERDRYVITGSQEFVQEEVERINHEHQLIGNRDIGYWVGEQLDEVLKKSPLRRQLKIRWNTVKEPPLVEANGNVGKWSECNIPEVKLNLSWAEVKAAADEFKKGGQNGNWQMTYKCYRRAEFVGNLVVSGFNEDECERRARKLKNLMPTDIDLRKPKPTKIYPTSPMFRSDLAQYYPIDCTLTVHTNSIDDAERRQRRGRVHTATPDDPYFEKDWKVELWMSAAPPDFNGFR